MSFVQKYTVRLKTPGQGKKPLDTGLRGYNFDANVSLGQRLAIIFHSCRNFSRKWQYIGETCSGTPCRLKKLTSHLKNCPFIFPCRYLFRKVSSSRRTPGRVTRTLGPPLRPKGWFRPHKVAPHRGLLICVVPSVEVPNAKSDR